MNIGNKIKELRKSRKMSQEKLGYKLGVSQAMIAQYENGKRNPKIQTIIKIAGILEVRPFDLMSVDEYETLIKHEAAEEFDNVIKRIIPVDEKILRENYNKLNDFGKEEALKRISELTEIPKYKKEIIELFAGPNTLKDVPLSCSIELNTDDDKKED